MDTDTFTDATPDASDESLATDEGYDNYEDTGYEEESETLEDSEELPETDDVETEEELEEEESDEDRRARKKANAPKDQKKKPTQKELAEADLDALVTVKIDGQTKKMTVRELQKLSSLEQVSQKRMQEAATERRRAAQLMQLAKDDPERFFELVGVDASLVDKIAESRLSKKYERMSMSEEERAQAEKLERLENFERQEAKSKDELIAQIEDAVGRKAPPELKGLSKERLQQVLAQAQENNNSLKTNLDTEIGSAWKESGLPKDPYFVQMIAAQMLNHQKRTGEALQAGEAAATVKKNFLSAVRKVSGAMDPQGILDMLGPETVKKVRSHLVARATGRLPASDETQRANRPGQSPASKQPKMKEMSPFEAREYMASLKRELRD